jgi:hypothetical protein
VTKLDLILFAAFVVIVSLVTEAYSHVSWFVILAIVLYVVLRLGFGDQTDRNRDRVKLTADDKTQD